MLCTPRDTVAGGRVGCFPNALAGDPPDQIITLEPQSDALVGGVMIARTWHGVTPAAKADDYLRLMLTVAVPDYQAIPGNRGVYVLRRIEGETAHFLLLTLWDSAEALRQFAGMEMEAAKYYDFDSAYLLELERTVTHYDVFAAPPNT